MRFFGIIAFSFLLLNLCACKSAQKASETNIQTKSEEKILLKVDSLKNISKKLYLLKNKKLELSDTNGSINYKIVDSEKTDVLQFVYEKDMDKVAYDGGYKEEVVFEIPSNIPEQNYTDAELQNTKMLFGRYCFCRGKTGLYKVNQGKLHITSSKKETHFELQFKINEVPQVINEVIY